MTEVSIRGRDMLRASATAVLLACLFGALMYYLPLERGVPQSAFGFVWATGDTSLPESDNNVRLERVFFEVKFYFANGTGVSIPAVYPPYLSTGLTLPENLLLEYHGEIDATSLTTIGVRFIPYGFGWLRPTNATATLKIHESRLADVLLVSEDLTTGMGRHEFLSEIRNIWFNETGSMTHIEAGELTKNTGYFVERHHTNVPTWNITVDKLSQMLPDTGTATIEFNVSVEISVHYNITINGDTKTGDTRLIWNGMLGTYQLNCDQGRLLSVKYDFVSVFLFLELKE